MWKLYILHELCEYHKDGCPVSHNSNFSTLPTMPPPLGQQLFLSYWWVALFGYMTLNVLAFSFFVIGCTRYAGCGWAFKCNGEAREVGGSTSHYTQITVENVAVSTHQVLGLKASSSLSALSVMPFPPHSHDFQERLKSQTKKKKYFLIQILLTMFVISVDSSSTPTLSSGVSSSLNLIYLSKSIPFHLLGRYGCLLLSVTMYLLRYKDFCIHSETDIPKR